MDQQKPDLKNQNASPANADAGVGAEAPASATHAPAPDSAPSAAPTPAKDDGKANPAPTTDPKKGPAGKDKKKPPKAYRPIPNETYLRRRKQKRVALVVLGVAVVGCFILGMVAFLGNYSGQFTVKIDSKASLTMDGDDGSFTKKTSFLKATGLENAQTTYADYIPLGSDIDNTQGGSKNGYYIPENRPSDDYKIGRYVAYTFFVKNVAKDDTGFNLAFNLDAYKNGINQACSLVDIVRVRVYANYVTDGTETHDMKTYAKLSEDGVNPELVSYADSKNAANSASSTPFLSDKLVFSDDYTLASQGEIRYTVLLWLEGYDPDCKGSAPEGAFVSFSMFFSVI